MPACPKYAISYVDDDYSETGVRIVIDYELCHGCGLCVNACCGGAIELV